jgi:maltose-binding protein MalE
MSTNDNILDHLQHNARGQNDGQRLVYNAAKGAFEVESEAQAGRNPDTVVAPYDRMGFFIG